MLSICVATDDKDGASWLQAGMRLRDTTVAVANSQSECPASQAVVFAGKRPVDLKSVEETLQAGRHAIVAGEAYFAAKDCAALAATAKTLGVIFGVVNPDMHLPSRQLIKQQLVVGKLGRVGLIRSHRWSPPRVETADDLAEIPAAMIRDIEAAIWLAESRPTLVFAVSQPHYIQVHLGFTSGMALLDFTDGLPPGDGYRTLSVIASTGAAYIDDQQNAQLVFRGGPPEAVVAGEGLKARVSLLQEFVATIKGERDAAAALALRRDTQAAVDAVKQSLFDRRAVVPEGR